MYGEKKRAGGDGDEGEEVPKKRKTKKKKGLTEEEEQEIEDARDARRQRTLGGNPNPVVPVRGGGGGGADTTDDEAPAPAPAKKKRTTTTNPNPKAYVPRKGSGAYAILLSLYSQSSYDDHGVWLLIRQITEVAQQYSENSFEKVSAAPGAGGQGAGTYTAWNGNKTRTFFFFALSSLFRACSVANDALLAFALSPHQETSRRRSQITSTLSTYRRRLHFSSFSRSCRWNPTTSTSSFFLRLGELLQSQSPSSTADEWNERFRFGIRRRRSKIRRKE